MVNFLSNWIEGIAVAVILASIFEMLLPKGNIKKYVKMILGVYIVFSMISPFVNSKELYNLNVQNILDTYSSNITSSNSSNLKENDIEEMYIETFEKEISNIVEKQGYNVSSCKVEADLNKESNSSGIKKIIITIKSKKNEVSKIETVNQVQINISNQTSNENTETILTEQETKELKKYLGNFYNIDKNIIYINER